MEPVRVVLVDDSAFVQRAVERMLEPVQEIQVVGTASDGAEGVDCVRRLRPDVVVLDIDMPNLNGLDAIRAIMDTLPTPILVLSSHARPGAEITLKALELGAVDFVSKSQAGTRMDIYELAPLLREKVLAVAASRLPSPPEPPPAADDLAGDTGAADAVSPPAPRPGRRPPGQYDLVVVGASTGGPRALATLLGGLPADFPAGVLLAQHMPAGFTATLAERLDRRSALTVREAQDGDHVEPGLALVGPGGQHLQVERVGAALVARVSSVANGFLHRPSVDLLFNSAARAAGPRAIGVILTGMGHDGAEGLAAIRDKGGRTLAESEETAVIYGMPAAAAGAAERILPLENIPSAILDLFSPGAQGWAESS